MTNLLIQIYLTRGKMHPPPFFDHFYFALSKNKTNRPEPQLFYLLFALSCICNFFVYNIDYQVNKNKNNYQ